MARHRFVACAIVCVAALFSGVSTAAQDSATAGPGAPAVTDSTKTAKPAAPSESQSHQAAPVQKKPVEEDLYEEMFVPEKGVAQPARIEAPAMKPDTFAAKNAASQKPADTSKAAAAPVDTAQEVPALAPAVAAPSADTAGKTVSANKPAAPVKVEEARPINFAKNLKEYRSPKLAMLMSLIIPGLGQAYIKSWVRAGFYVLAEAAIISASVVYINKGKDRNNEAKAFADRNYSSTKMIGYYNALDSFVKHNYYATTTNPDSAATAKMYDIYFDSAFTGAGFKGSADGKTQDFYRRIESGEYIQGWNDCQPTLDEITSVNAGISLADKAGYKYLYTRYDSVEQTYLVNIQDKTSGASIATASYGYSDSLLTYKRLRNQSNENYKTGTYILYAILINHIVSAVDALIAANVYNSNLLGKQTFWRNVDLQPSVAGVDGISSPGLALRIRF
jgi:hypothetical protein